MRATARFGCDAWRVRFTKFSVLFILLIVSSIAYATLWQSSDMIIHQPRAVVAQRLRAAAPLPHGVQLAGIPMLGIAVRKDQPENSTYEWRFQAMGNDYARYQVTLSAEDRQTTRASFNFQRLKPAKPLDRRGEVRNYRYLQDIAEIVATAHVRAAMDDSLVDLVMLNAAIQELPSHRNRRVRDYASAPQQQP